MWIAFILQFLKCERCREAIAALGVMGLLIGSYYYGYYGGMNESNRRWNAKAAEEQVRQAEVNAAAKRAEKVAIDSLVAEKDRLQAVIERNENEARNDPAANNCGVSASGMRRLNTIR